MRPSFLVVLSTVVAACGEPPQVASDAGSPRADAATIASDASASGPDTGSASEPDAAVAEPGADAASIAMHDASIASGPDAAASVADAGGGNPCAPQFAGCSTYVDATAANASRTISFPGQQYSPKCLKIALGQSVTFSGSFSYHPLEQACGPAEVLGRTASGSSKSFVFDSPGEYGYFCTAHGTAAGSGMAGSILVQ